MLGAGESEYDGAVFEEEANGLGLSGGDSALWLVSMQMTLLLFLRIYSTDTLKQEVVCELVNQR